MQSCPVVSLSLLSEISHVFIIKSINTLSLYKEIKEETILVIFFPLFASNYLVFISLFKHFKQPNNYFPKKKKLFLSSKTIR